MIHETFAEVESGLQVQKKILRCSSHHYRAHDTSMVDAAAPILCQNSFTPHSPASASSSSAIYCVALTALSTALAKYSTLLVLRPAMEIRPFLVM